jgi:hypothetical protein
MRRENRLAQVPLGRASHWPEFFVYRRESLTTTWKCRLLVILVVGIIASLTRGSWIPAIAGSLICTPDIQPSDVILVENFDPDYLVFESAATLQQAGLAARVLVPTAASRRDPAVVSVVDRGIAELMARVARVKDPEIIPVRHDAEPIGLNSTYDIRAFLTRERVKSVLVVSPAFRSRRSSLVYTKVLTPVGIEVHCLPVFGEHTPQNWTGTWHGLQDVALQFIKLQFYRFDVFGLRGFKLWS